MSKRHGGSSAIHSQGKLGQQSTGEKAQRRMITQLQSTASTPVIAVVDDDPAVCNSLKFSLELDGFVVRVYRSGAEFLAAGSFRDCNCLVVDQRMPGMSGMELISELRERKVSAPAILIISQANKVLSARAAEAHVPIIEKPFLNDALVEKIREVCARA
jgi:two-component system, LuxR family, response regulator FixJ